MANIIVTPANNRGEFKLRVVVGDDEKVFESDDYDGLLSQVYDDSRLAVHIRVQLTDMLQVLYAKEKPETFPWTHGLEPLPEA